MAVTVTVAGQAAQSYPLAGGPVTLSLPVPVTMTPGDWLVALVAWKQAYTGWSFTVSGTPLTASYFIVTAAQAASISAGQQFTDTSNPGTVFTVTGLSAPSAGFVNVSFTPAAATAMNSGDTVTQLGVTVSAADGANWWDPLGQPSGTSPGAGITRCAIWAAPAARTPPAGLVMIAPTGFALAIAAVIYDVAGLSPWSQLQLITTGFANAATALSQSLAAPASQSLVLAMSGSDFLTASVTLAAGGWSAVTSQTSGDGSDHAEDINCSAAWQVTTGATTAAWSSTAAVNFSGVMAAIGVAGTAPAQPNPAQPYAVTEIAPGAGPSTPPDRLAWVSLGNRPLALALSQGRQYTLGQLQAGQGTMTLDQADLALIPPGTGAFKGIDSGTPFRTRAAWPGGAWQAQFHGDGVTANPQLDTGQFGSLAPGNTYSASAFVACSQPYAPGVQLGLQFINGAGGVISTITTGIVTGTVPVLVAVTGTAPAGTVRAEIIITANGTPASSITFFAAAAPPGTSWVQPPPGVTWLGDNGATATTLAPWKEDPRGAPNVTPWYVDTAGFFSRWPPSWDELLRGQAVTTITDAWGYAGRKLQSVLRQEILADQPYAYWPCTDPNVDLNLRNILGCANIAPGNQNFLQIVLSKYGTGGATEALGQNSGAIPGDTTATITQSTRITGSAGMWQQVLPASPPGSTGYTLQCTDAGFPPVSGGITAEAWVQVIPPNPGGGLPAPEVLTVAGAKGALVQLYLDTSVGKLHITGTGITDTIVGAALNWNNMTVPAQVAVTLTQSAWTVYVNGAQTGTGAISPPLPARFTFLAVNGAQPPPGVVFVTQCYSGYAGHVAVFPRVLPAGRILAHYQAGSSSLAVRETASARVERLLAYAVLPGRRAIIPDGADPTPVVSCQDIGGQAASASLSNLAASTVPAVLAVRPTGDIAYLARQYAWNTPVAWVLGDSQSAGEIPAGPGVVIDYDPARVVNDIQVTGLDDQSVAVPQVPGTEAWSVGQYGDQPWTPVGYLANDPASANNVIPLGPGTQDLANWVANTQPRPRLRVIQATVDASRHPSAWPFVLAAGVGDPVTLNLRMPTAGGQLVAVTGRITQTTRNRQFSQEGAQGSITIVADAAPELNVLTADDPVKGQLDGTHPLAW